MEFTPEFLETEAGAAHVEALEDRVMFQVGFGQDVGARLRSITGSMAELENYLPWKYRKALPKEGGWIRVNRPPHTELTVPPFSQWFALNDPMEVDRFGFRLHRVRLATPSGPVWLFPHEYVCVQGIGQWVGRDDESVYLRYLDADNVHLNSDRLHYIMSRGIRRREAMVMILGEIQSPNFCWFEIRPEYAEQFGLDWPSATRCPFAMRPDDDNPEKQKS